MFAHGTHTNTQRRQANSPFEFSLILVQQHRSSLTCTHTHKWSYCCRRNKEKKRGNITHHIELCYCVWNFYWCYVPHIIANARTKKKSIEQISHRTVTIIQLNSILLPLLGIRHFKLWHLFVCLCALFLSLLPYAVALMSNITQFCLESEQWIPCEPSGQHDSSKKEHVKTSKRTTLATKQRRFAVARCKLWFEFAEIRSK